ncbi:hypothetical protein MM326_13950 [Alkalihalobacillus sp. LMS6]|uniref:hypothetical protein n=1 Tax=Alkalihalobacillus sp. LMS6 TaxID=2924034 RepID=UPI0020D1F0A7|nr:hypothetical protein [Alkalihalobacillus sp. LMS6]UTR05206.1 hypothetical protein MM326_13950 [Alkalihalobacillus sp. LMS6]
MIKLTENYAIRSDGALNFQLLEYRIVDPTKAPGWKRKVAENPALDPTPRPVWQPLESFHGRMESALNRVVVLESMRWVSEQEDGDPAELEARLTVVHDMLRVVMRTHDFIAELKPSDVER